MMTCDEYRAFNLTSVIDMTRGMRASFLAHQFGCRDCLASRFATTDQRHAGKTPDQLAAEHDAVAELLATDFYDPEFMAIAGPAWDKRV